MRTIREIEVYATLTRPVLGNSMMPLPTAGSALTTTMKASRGVARKGNAVKLSTRKVALHHLGSSDSGLVC
jgi:hypothetical protein